MEIMEQEHAFLTIIKDEDALLCFVWSREGGERVSFPRRVHFPGLFSLVSGAGSALAFRQRRSRWAWHELWGQLLC